MPNLLSERLRLLRHEKKITQVMMAREILLPRVTYTHYELGKRTPDLETIIQLAHFHQVSVDYLVGNTNLRPTLEQWLSERSLSGNSGSSRHRYIIQTDDSARLIADLPDQDPADPDQ